jgi:hypothetical protein
MSPRKTTKVVFGQIPRSGFYYSALSNLPVRRASEMDTGFDLLGTMTVVSLSAGALVLVRFILTN